MYKAYVNSVDSTFLVVIVMSFIILGQIAISSVDLFVSKWYVYLSSSEFESLEFERNAYSAKYGLIDFLSLETG